MTKDNHHLLPTISLILAMLLWASSLVALKIAFRGYHPMQVIFGRMLIASLCFIPFIPGFFRLNWRHKDLKYLLIMAICEPCLYFIFEAKALELTSASQAGMITAMLPLLVAILAWIWLKERISQQTLLGFIFAISGSIWLSLASDNNNNAPNPLLGNFYEFLAMACAAGYTVSLKHLTNNYPPLFLTAFQALLGSLFFFPFLLLPDIGFPTNWESGPGMAIIYLGTFITFGAYGCYNFSVSRIPASQAAGYVNLIPVFGVVLGMLILDDTLNLWQWFACGLVFCGVWLSSSGHRRKIFIKHPDMEKLMRYNVDPIATIRSPFREKFSTPRQPGLTPSVGAQVVLHPEFSSPEAVRGLEGFSHLWLIFLFHQNYGKGWKPTVRPPRLGGNQRVGVFGCRSPFRPNPIGLSAVKLLSITCEQGKVTLEVQGADLMDGTPILDIKPYLPYTDGIPEATGGFANRAPTALLQVSFSAEAKKQLTEFSLQTPQLEVLICEALTLDPRPAYKRGSDVEREYGVLLDRYNVRWMVEEEKVVVLGIVVVDD